MLWSQQKVKKIKKGLSEQAYSFSLLSQAKMSWGLMSLM